MIEIRVGVRRVASTAGGSATTRIALTDGGVRASRLCDIMPNVIAAL